MNISRMTRREFARAMAISAVGMGSARGAKAASAAEQAFVRISPRDSRYLELTDGRRYIPIGLNLAISPTGISIGVSRVGELDDYERWFRKLSQNHGNYARIWLSSPAFDVERTRSGQYDQDRAQKIDQLLVLARRYGIRLKLCLDHFRHVGDGPQPHFAKPLHHVQQGGPAGKTADFFDSPRGRQQFLGKLAWFQKRYGDDPIIFGWELWNEMDCIAGGDWAGWTDVMLGELHRLFPRNLAMQSLGGFENARVRAHYQRLCAMAGNDVLQVHRYLNMGASLTVCHGPVDVLAADAVRELRAFNADKPILLAESGAVEKHHAGPFKLYEKDSAGIIFHDVLFAPFFAGAAAPGHVWHWDVYVERMNLWHHLARFARAIEGVDPAAERFQPVAVEHPRLRILALKGRDSILAWCRDKQNNWQSELAEGQTPDVIKDVSIDLVELLNGSSLRKILTYDPWEDHWTSLRAEGTRVVLPKFSRSLVLKVETSNKSRSGK